MGLQLQPTYTDLTREQIENWLETVRARRMVAAIQFQEKETTKRSAKARAINDKITRQYATLKREIDRLDELIDKVEARMTAIDELRVELGLYQ